MKKILLVMLAAVMILGVTACGKSDDKKDAKEEFKVGFDAEYPPYGYMADDGSYTGFDIELAKKVCEINNWEIKLVPIEWDYKDNELDSGTIDCIWSGFTINGREKDYTWSDPYVENSQVVVVSDKTDITSLNGLSGKTVGVQAGSAALTLLQDEEGQKALGDTFKELKEFADYNTGFSELLAGTIDALAMDVGVAKYQVESRGEGCKILEEYLNEEEYGIGFKTGNTELRDKVQSAIDTLKKDGTFEKIAKDFGIEDLVIKD